MSIHVALHHRTAYRYDRRITLGPQVVRLRPAPHARPHVLSYALRVEPQEHFINWQQDPFANYLARLSFPDRTDSFTLEVGLVLEMAVFNPFDFFLEPGAEFFPFEYEAALRHDLAPYLAVEPTGSRLAKLLAGVDRQRQRSIDFVVQINRLLQREVRYLIRMEPGVQTCEETLGQRSGSCRDSAWLLVQCLRNFGLAARFVSGYLVQLKADVKALDGPSGTEQDFTDLHAWCEIYLPGAGWIGLDPTSGLLAGEGHVPLACTPDPTSAAPVTGEIEKCEVVFTHEMSVTRIFESPRVTFPYTAERWAQIDALGHRIDEQLRDDDVRLTMGGEPTFVAAEDRDGAEWNTAALGPSKRAYATDLLLRLREKYGAGGFLHFGQGKWYPGEPLPRWALSVYWRRDGQPAWRDPGRFADERTPGGYDSDDAHRLMLALVARLQLEPRYAVPAYEDVWYYMWRERRLPVNVDPFESRLEDELERARLLRLFGAGLASVAGYALPLRRAEPGEPSLNGTRWLTGPWFFRGERMYLIPGDSPMGWRLPLDSLPWTAPGDLVEEAARDPFEARSPLPEATRLLEQYRPRGGEARATESAGTGRAGTGRGGSGGAGVRGAGSATGGAGKSMGTAAADSPPVRFVSAKGLTRTALCIEARGGNLYVFLPPLARLEDYLELLAAIEAVLEDLGMRVVLEGYPPPHDERLQKLSITPDPGVVEVNIHPASSWAELVDHTEHLYEAARLSRLSAEKFMIDGRHTGTGGGNHFVLGGPSVGDSPLLRRPDLLASLIAYWHNHPALSYLFSGLFIGPTSQAPRVDEARNDQVYELEIALAELHRSCGRGTEARPWMVDRLLRNVLIDVTGNTHRAEFCIDKLYSPDGPTGRLGLLELRAFEMPPHARMSLVQQLLLRALVARFWREPYRAELTRWNTELHDRFMLPAFIELDLDDVIEELRTLGYGFERAWFAPHFAFRFPHYGEVAVRGLNLVLRGALEPWHVMGEETSTGGTVRYVDSSLERLEVRVTGFNARRHALAVNGRAIALQPTGTEGEFVAGVRYRAWAAASALHPTIGVHAPLRFDLVDTWMQRSLGGCTYHVAHPGGRHYETLPVNAFEAESRRLARFFRGGHAAGRIDPAVPAPLREFPFTLDLRR